MARTERAEQRNPGTCTDGTAPLTPAPEKGIDEILTDCLMEIDGFVREVLIGVDTGILMNGTKNDLVEVVRSLVLCTDKDFPEEAERTIQHCLGKWWELYSRSYWKFEHESDATEMDRFGNRAERTDKTNDRLARMNDRRVEIEKWFAFHGDESGTILRSVLHPLRVQLDTFIHSIVSRTPQLISRVRRERSFIGKNTEEKHVRSLKMLLSETHHYLNPALVADFLNYVVQFIEKERGSPRLFQDKEFTRSLSVLLMVMRNSDFLAKMDANSLAIIFNALSRLESTDKELIGALSKKGKSLCRHFNVRNFMMILNSATHIPIQDEEFITLLEEQGARLVSRMEIRDVALSLYSIALIRGNPHSRFGEMLLEKVKMINGGEGVLDGKPCFEIDIEQIYYALQIFGLLPSYPSIEALFTPQRPQPSFSEEIQFLPIREALEEMERDCVLSLRCEMEKSTQNALRVAREARELRGSEREDALYRADIARLRGEESRNEYRRASDAHDTVGTRTYYSIRVEGEDWDAYLHRNTFESGYECDFMILLCNRNTFENRVINVELDGGFHDSYHHSLSDVRRDSVLRRNGIVITRLKNLDSDALKSVIVSVIESTLLQKTENRIEA